MKKMLVVLLAGLMLLSFTGSAFAADFGAMNNVQMQSEKKGLRFEALKEFADEIHEINALRIERNVLRGEIIEKQDGIIDLYIEARESGDKEALQEAKEIRKEIKDKNNEIKDNHKSAVEERKAFREDVINEDFGSAEEHMNEIINIQTSINELITQKIDLLNQIIDVLSIQEAL